MRPSLHNICLVLKGMPMILIHRSIFVLALIVLIMSAVNVRAQSETKSETNHNAAAKLSEEQLKSIKAIRMKWAQVATPIALHLAKAARAVYENMLRDKEDPQLRATLSGEMHRAAAELLNIKGQSIREVVRVLTPEQRQLLKEEMKKPDAPADLMELADRTFNIAEN